MRRATSELTSREPKDVFWDSMNKLHCLLSVDKRLEISPTLENAKRET